MNCTTKCNIWQTHRAGCDETRRPERVFPKAHQNTLEKQNKAGAPPLPTTSQHTTKQIVDKQVNSCTKNILVEINYMYNTY